FRAAARLNPHCGLLLLEIGRLHHLEPALALAVRALERHAVHVDERVFARDDRPELRPPELTRLRAAPAVLRPVDIDGHAADRLRRPSRRKAFGLSGASRNA